jgi:16S rRNA (cytosine967-C5)-methyltransferase
VAERQKEQRAVLDVAARLVKPGGRLAYVTCSVLPEENTGQVARFLSEEGRFRVVPPAEAWAGAMGGGAPPESADGSSQTLLLTPATHGTDGFFVALLQASEERD